MSRLEKSLLKSINNRQTAFLNHKTPICRNTTVFLILKTTNKMKQRIYIDTSLIGGYFEHSTTGEKLFYMVQKGINLQNI